MIIDRVYFNNIRIFRTILLAKLEKYGIQGNSLELFKSYLKDRKQVCSVNGKLLTAKDIKCGVPQGSNLGPILFYYI